MVQLLSPERKPAEEQSEADPWASYPACHVPNENVIVLGCQGKDRTPS